MTCILQNMYVKTLPMFILGNGIVIITSPERLELRCFHTITARRYNQDGELKVDSGYSTAGHSRGKFKALDLKRDGYIGHVRTNYTRYK